MTHPLALSVINDSKSYQKRLKLMAKPEYQKALHRMIVDMALEERRVFGSILPTPRVLEEASRDLIEYMEEHMKEM